MSTTKPVETRKQQLANQDFRSGGNNHRYLYAHPPPIIFLTRKNYFSDWEKSFL